VRGGRGERANLQVPNQEAREELEAMQAAREERGGGGVRMHMRLSSEVEWLVWGFEG